MNGFNLQVFNYQEREIRVIQKDNQDWWVAKDVCDILDVANVTQAVSKLDSDERSMFNIGRQGEVNIINEPGLYKLILRSDKPEAKPFIRWITHEVIPSIRKTGSYSVNPSIINATKLYEVMLPSLKEAHATPKDLTECMIRLVHGIEKKERKELQKKQKKQNLSRERQEILDVFTENIGKILHPLEVAKLTGKSIQSVRKIIWRMERDRQLYKKYNGEYYLEEPVEDLFYGN